MLFRSAANGNNAIVINSEFRLPVISTIFDRTVSNAFLNDLQLTQFIDIGSAWNGSYKKIHRPIYTNSIGETSQPKGLGPFLGGYGFGARSTLFGYFIKYDVSWPMEVVFKGRPVQYISLGLDF